LLRQDLELHLVPVLGMDLSGVEFEFEEVLLSLKQLEEAVAAPGAVAVVLLHAPLEERLALEVVFGEGVGEEGVLGGDAPLIVAEARGDSELLEGLGVTGPLLGRLGVPVVEGAERADLGAVCAPRARRLHWW